MDENKNLVNIKSKIEKSIEPSCEICNHIDSDSATKVYFQSDKNIMEVKRWFSKKYNQLFSIRDLTIHFEEHVLPYIDENEFLKNEIIKKILNQVDRQMMTATSSITVIKQMAFNFLTEIYASRKTRADNKSEVYEQSSIIRNFNETAKVFRDYQKLELEMIGMGRSEEEQKEIMQNYIKATIKQALEVIKDYPDAQEKLSSYLNMGNKTFQSDYEVVEGVN